MKRIIGLQILLIIASTILFAQDKQNISIAKKDTSVWVKKSIQENFVQSKLKELNQMQVQLDARKKAVDADQKAIDGAIKYYEGQMDLINLLSDSVLVDKRKLE